MTAEEEAVKEVPEEAEELIKIKPRLPGEITRLLKIRARLKARNPRFVRCESWRLVRVKENWRRPRGISSKMRLEVKGWPPRVKSGYGKPKAVRHLHPSGFKEVLVYRPEDLDKVDPETQAIRIAHSVGRKKRLAIIERARELQIRVLNPSIR